MKANRYIPVLDIIFHVWAEHAVSRTTEEKRKRENLLCRPGRAVGREWRGEDRFQGGGNGAACSLMEETK